MEGFSPKKSLSIIRTIHFALIGGIVLFMGAVGFLIQSKRIEAQDLPDVIGYIPYIAIIIAYPLASFLLKDSLKKIDKEAPLSKKMAQFNTAHIVHVAVYEGFALLSTIVAMLTADLLLLAVPSVIVLLMALSTPTVFKLEQLIGLSQEEKAEFDATQNVDLS